MDRRHDSSRRGASVEVRDIPLVKSESPVVSGGRGFAQRATRALLRLASDRSYRNVVWLRLSPRGQAFQPFNDTKSDRYPVIFSFVQRQLGTESRARLLSFGCSTGEEVFSLRNYFPRAVIKGIDINAGNIAVCQRRLRRSPDAGISFAAASSTHAEPANAFDTIFCMAVLRHGALERPGVGRCDHLISFEAFARVVDDFRRCLKPGGLLVITHSNFRLCDAPAGVAFEAILRVNLADAGGPTPIFGPDNLLMPSVDYPDTVFRKLS
jgi:SAM-dependent methyltransferase